MMMTHNSRSEEVMNSITHALGLGLGIAACVYLIVRASMDGNAWHIVSVSLYGSTLIALYLASTLYHSLTFTRAHAWLRVLDHASIYLFIAGSYIPFALVPLRGGWGWSIFGVITGLALLGILALCFVRRKIFPLTSVLSLLMGWTIVIAAVPLVQRISMDALLLLLAGGITYSLGVIFFASKRPFAHTAWHLMVLFGSGFHFIAILSLLPTLPH